MNGKLATSLPGHAAAAKLSIYRIAIKLKYYYDDDGWFVIPETYPFRREKESTKLARDIWSNRPDIHLCTKSLCRSCSQLQEKLEARANCACSQFSEHKWDVGYAFSSKPLTASNLPLLFNFAE